MLIEDLIKILPPEHWASLQKKYDEIPNNEKEAFVQKASILGDKYKNSKAEDEAYAAVNPSLNIKDKLKPSTFKKNTSYGNKEVGIFEWKKVFKNSKWQNYYFTGNGWAAIIKAGTFEKPKDVVNPEAPDSNVSTPEWTFWETKDTWVITTPITDVVQSTTPETTPTSWNPDAWIKENNSWSKTIKDYSDIKKLKSSIFWYRKKWLANLWEAAELQSIQRLQDQYNNITDPTQRANLYDKIQTKQNIYKQYNSEQNPKAKVKWQKNMAWAIKYDYSLYEKAKNDAAWLTKNNQTAEGDAKLREAESIKKRLDDKISNYNKY